MRQVTIGLIGVGDILDCHLCALKANPEYRLTGICRRSPEKLRKQADELNVKGYLDYRDMLNDRPDVVLISLPHNLHYQVAVDAITAGCYVLMEKPLAVKMREVNDLMELSGKTQKAIVVTESSYWLPSFRTAGNIVRSGAMGKLLFGNYINHRYYYNDSRPDWFLKSETSGGGQFINIGIHRIAAVRCIVGDEYEEVSVAAGVHRIHPEHDIETATQAFVTYAGGESVMYEECGYHQPPEDLRRGVHFVFEKGMLGIANNHIWTSDAEGNVTRHRFVDEHPGGAYGGIYRQMLKAILGQDHYPAIHHCARDTRIALAAYCSAQNRMPVDLRSRDWQLAEWKAR